MDELGLFPLPIVLVPTERTPLHVFEPRYRELIGECLDTGGEFGLVLETEEELRRVGTRARVANVLARLPDGRMNVVVEGGDRFRLVRETDARSFRTAEVEPLVDVEPRADEAEVEEALRAFGRLARAAEAKVELPEVGETRVAFRLAAQVELPAEAKQELLELRSERARLELVTRVFSEAADALELTKAARQRASGNGSISN